MSVTKSILNSVDLEPGEFYAQAGHNGDVVLSFDGPTIQCTVRLTKSEATAVLDTLARTLNEMETA